MHTIGLIVMQLVLVLIIYFMEDNNYSLLILMFGVFTPDLSEAVTYKYVQELKSRLEHAFRKANEFCNKEAIRSKKRFDKTAKCSKLLPGDLVLVRRKGFTTKHKIADKWETEPYERSLRDLMGYRSILLLEMTGKELCNMLFPLGIWHDT